ncbi:MAG TPA: hypothetical protein VFE78_00520 [Gemmataceae bacterium]|jgi:hypothetical protein|nr:hypothetical protein [Gemmataceae bacterium]
MPSRKPPLTEDQILAWADAHCARTGRWPHSDSGPVLGVRGQTWQAVNKTLVRGGRGLPGVSSLAQLLEERRGKRNKARTPPLTVAQILRWADLHRGRTGRWPGENSGPVLDAPGEGWSAVNQALRAGRRGLPGGDTLVRLLRRSGRWRRQG